MMSLLLKCLLGAVAVLLIALLSKSKSFFVAGLVPLFPTFALIAHYIVGTEQIGGRSANHRAVWPLVARSVRAIYLVAVYYLSTRLSLAPTLVLATVAWTVGAIVLLVDWSKAYPM